MKARAKARGFTMVELLVAVSVLSMICLLIYSAFAGMKRSRDGLQRINDRYREGRLAMQRIARELQSAYLSKHQPINPQFAVRQTAFVGRMGTPADRVDFNSFSGRRLDRDSHESDQIEISYFGSPDPEQNGVTDLARRVDKSPDLEPDRGGRVDVLATDIDLFHLEYLDPMTGQWVETWDTTQAVGQADRMPLQVRVVLVLNGGRRSAAGRGQGTIRLATKVPIQIAKPLTFAVQ